MPPLPPIPVSRLLVPALANPLPASFTTVTIALDAGIPFTYALDARWSVTLRYPTGVMRAWLDAGPGDVVSSDLAERVPLDPSAAPDGRDPVRLAVARDREVRAVLPLAAGRRALVVDDGVRPASLELAVVSWTITAGTVRGPGAFGSSLTLAWRDVTPAIDVFSSPAVPAAVAARQPKVARRAAAGDVEVAPMESVTAVLLDRELVVLDPLPRRRRIGS